MPAEPVTSESLRKSGALVVPNQTALDDGDDDFVPNLANGTGGRIFALNPTVCVGLSHLIPVYADRSHCAKPLSGRYDTHRCTEVARERAVSGGFAY